MVCTLPKLLSIMCIGTEILNAKAQLFSILTAKKSKARRARRERGIFGEAMLTDVGEGVLEEVEA